MPDNSRRTGAALEAHFQFLVWLAQTVEKFPRNHKFTVGDRIQVIAINVLEALIEATYTRERTQHLRQANLGIEKLRFLLRLASELRSKAHDALAWQVARRLHPVSLLSALRQVETRRVRRAGCAIR